MAINLTKGQRIEIGLSKVGVGCKFLLFAVISLLITQNIYSHKRTTNPRIYNDSRQINYHLKSGINSEILLYHCSREVNSIIINSNN
jgi:hypothetical protein